MVDADDILAGLGVEEKISLLVGAGLSRIVLGAAGDTRSIARLGIPGIVLCDGPAGVRIHPLRLGDARKYYVISFPNEILLASSWNLDLVRSVGRAIGEEARFFGIDVMLAPGLNMHRLPIGGRVFEYFSEDPLLSGEMASAYVEGVQSTGVGATLKHFVAHEQEANRLLINVVVSERALREIYLKPFEIAVRRARPWAVMAAYNKLNGKYCTQNPWLLTKVLREEWGYDGLVMTDWFAGDNSVEQILSGIDLIMPGSDETVARLVEAYRKGVISDEIINLRARKVLELVLKSPRYRGLGGYRDLDFEGHARIAYEAAVEGVVLLKNDGALPLSGKPCLALFGRGSYWTVKGGLGSGDSYPRYVVSIADGLKERGVLVDEEVERIYRSLTHRFYELGESVSVYRRLREKALAETDARLLGALLTQYFDAIVEYMRVMHLQEDPFTDDLLEKVAERCNAAVITISRISTEGFDRFPVKGDYYLRDDELSLISRVSGAFHKHGKRVIVVLNIPSPIDITSWRDLVDAILVLWLPGQEAGRALADILLGKVSPSGKLPLTWPKDLYETPAMRTYPGTPRENPVGVVYSEDIYLGYRYYDTFALEPAYEFGYGLSYTAFEYRDLEVKLDGESVIARLRVVNKGPYPGKEVVQIYVKAPGSGVYRPLQELKGFYKTKLLESGEGEDIEVKIPLEMLAMFSGGKWVVEGGVYEIRVGASSRDIRLKTTLEIPGIICYDASWNKTAC
ncbi:beta-glucosidase [Desulfurococcaceae archaeon AG1]|nr:beta-glucosidase [Desulfurococcaceae archaeon AG1]